MSDDYIKRADAIELIARHDDTDGTIKVFSDRFVNGLISAVPPADVVEIVRCKDCKHLDKGENDSESWCECTRIFGTYFDVSEDDFCRYGERKDEGL